ncbi:alpha-amylase family glycosyl hydrolase [Paenibacillus sp. MMS18-CY102]|uniref:alpha-amylase family glycosyl hydrolase n=1 Tax=Paenibacillus sp. MMS18-CY102 TaxID=2682849 RepID=UPI0013659B89|nr:alpha-amylase family glycosyl hydrolase [Paenibacillus sp. MMS18-CY102]
MRRKSRAFIAALVVLVMTVGQLIGGGFAVQAAVGLQSPVIGLPNATGTGADVTFNYQGSGSETSAQVKGEFYKNWGENIELALGAGNVWSVTREVPAGWYEYGLMTNGSAWQGDPLNSVRKNSNPGLSVPGVRFNTADEFALGTETVVSATYFTGNADEQFAPVLSVTAPGLSIANGKLAVAGNATTGPVDITATYNGFTATKTVNIVGQALQSPVINTDGSVTFNNKTEQGATLNLVGGMNGWDNHGIPMVKDANGVFSVTQNLTPGTYEYKFVPVSGKWDNAFTDPLNILSSNGNSVVHVPGIRINSANDIGKGGSVALSAQLVDPSGNVSDITPAWSLEQNKPGVSITGSALTVDPSYVVQVNDSVTVVADFGGKQAKKKISIQGKMYTFNLHYYRYDGNMANWDNWIFNSYMGGTEYDFTGTDADGFVTVQVKLPFDSISAIQRPGAWTSQDLTHVITVPAGETSVDAWMLEKKPDVYYDRASALDAKAHPPVKRYIELTYVRADQDYTDWNLWVWGTGAKNDRIDFSKFENGVAVARIEISDTTSRMGFKVRKGDWVETDMNTDRYVEAPLDQVITKATVTSGQLEVKVVPNVTGPVFNDGKVTFFYRDEQLYNNNQMDTITGVQVKVTQGNQTQTYDMTYRADKQYFDYTLSGLQDGSYTYSFLVTRNGATTEVNDPKNTVNGVSAFDYYNPAVVVSGTVLPQAIASNENAVVTVNLASKATVTYREVYLDLTSLGGPAKFQIDQKLMQGTIAVADNVPAGDKIIPVVAIDQYGNKHANMIRVTVKTRQSVGSLDFDWDEARIYFLLTDRFKDGDETNNFNVDKTALEAYHGGDFKGLIEKLDYLKDLGINTVWISPIVDNNDFNQSTTIKQYGYHGYWAKNFEALDEHLGDLNTFKQLIDTAHDKGIKIMVDVVLNHTGYGLKPGDTNPNVSAEDKARFDGMLRTDNSMDEVTGELAGLPDFKTEDPAVRAKIIEWQTSWLERAKTDRGDTIDFFRIDTYKHVEDTTWKAFKNALTQINPKFKMIAENYGASIDNQGGALRSGSMDSLLDFDFNNRAEQFVKGGIDDVESYMEHRNALMDNTATMGQFLGSHDEEGFLSDHVGGDKGMLKVAAALQITSKGQPVIYYGEELGQSGRKGDFDNGIYNENRYDMAWDKLTDPAAVEEQALHAHYQKLLQVRASYSKVFAKGTRTKVAGGDSDGYLVFDRAYQGEHLLVGLNTTKNAKNLTLDVPFAAGQKVVDRYSGVEYTVSSNKQVTLALPGRDQGGTFVLTAISSSGGSVSTDVPPVVGGGGTPPVTKPETGSDTATTVTVDEKDLKEEPKDGKVSITVPSVSGDQGSTANGTNLNVVLPSNAAILVGSSAVEFTSGPLKVTLPSSVLAELQALAPAGSAAANGQIVMAIKVVPSAQADELLKQASKSSAAKVSLSGSMYELTVSYVGADGKAKVLTEFKEPVTLTFAADAKSSNGLQGIYYIADNGEITFLSDSMSAKVYHFSKYAVLTFDKTFTDISPSFWAAQDIKTMAAKHIVNGNTATTFNPNGQVTRAEFAALLVRALGLEASAEAKTPFSDVAAGAWYAPEVTAAYEAGVVSGADAAHFRPNAQVTREEMAVMIARALDKLGKLPAAPADAALLSQYGDGASVSAWAKEGMLYSLQAQILRGDAASKLQPSSYTTRAEAAVVLNRLLNYTK